MCVCVCVCVWRESEGEWSAYASWPWGRGDRAPRNDCRSPVVRSVGVGPSAWLVPVVGVDARKYVGGESSGGGEKKTTCARLSGRTPRERLHRGELLV